MVNFFSSWGQGIIVAVIIGTIIEMILPDGNSKKYIKVVIGIYILFTIISPFIQKFSGSKLNTENIFNTEKYEKMMSKGSNTISQKLEDNNSRTIKDIYIENLKNDIREKLKEKGYEAENIYLNVSDDGDYTVERLQIKIPNTANQNNENTDTKRVEINSVNVDKIEISKDKVLNSNEKIDMNIEKKVENPESENENTQTKENSNFNQIGNSKNSENEDGYNSSKKEEIKEYLSNTYNIEKGKIEIY